mmetsp:Transcript_6948/g.21133  ORF Transcript_6948/g.21133 Transcript_6948/m.21133 type:complete len:283 (+) Transcript_6948:157-1005(+)
MVMFNPPPLIPPLRFQVVEEGLYRGAFPSLKNYRFLRRLKLKTVVSLTPQDVSSADLREFCSHEDLRGFCAQEEIELIHFSVPKNQGFVTMTPQLAAQVVSLLIRCENHPLYVHCRDGGNNTGLVIMVLRRLQNWNLSSIFGEFIRHLKISETIAREESQFVESFRAEIEIPHNVPHWLFQGKVTSAHPTMRLRLLPPSPSELPEKGSDEETNLRRQKLIEAIHTAPKRIESVAIRGLLLANGTWSSSNSRSEEMPCSPNIAGLGLEGLWPLRKRSAATKKT